MGLYLGSSVSANTPTQPFLRSMVRRDDGAAAETMSPTAVGTEEQDHAVLRLEKPIFLKGPVVKGFGRGSKLLGIPTANLRTADFVNDLVGLENGIYLGWASVSGGEVYKTAMSIGENPFFHGKERTIEPHLLHEFEQDFYGEELRLVILGFIRPEANFTSLQALIDRIHEDIRITDKTMEHSYYLKFAHDAFFRDKPSPPCHDR